MCKSHCKQGAYFQESGYRILAIFVCQFVWERDRPCKKKDVRKQLCTIQYFFLLEHYTRKHNKISQHNPIHASSEASPTKFNETSFELNGYRIAASDTYNPGYVYKIIWKVKLACEQTQVKFQQKASHNKMDW